MSMKCSYLFTRPIQMEWMYCLPINSVADQKSRKKRTPAAKLNNTDLLFRVEVENDDFW